MINKKKLILTLAIILSFTGLSICDTIAITEKKTDTQEEIKYTNDIHSVLSLKDCVDIAIEHNPSIRSSIYNEEIYKSKIGQAWANYFPAISGGLDISRSWTKYSKDVMFSGRNVHTTMGYVPTISADMLLFDFGKTKAGADMAKRMYESTKEDTKENINSIIYGIKTIYFNILFAQAQVHVYEDTVKDYELQLQQAWGFYKLGKKAKIDVVTAEYNLGKAQLNLVKAKNVLTVAKVELSKVMGIPEYTNFELSDELILNKLDISEEKAIETALEVRPELVSARKSADAAKLNLRAARRDYTPDIGAYGSYGYGIGSDYNVSSAKVGVSLSYSGLNILRIKKQIDQASAQYKKAQADFDSVKDEVYFNVKKNYIDLMTAIEEINIAKLALDQAKEQYRQVTGRYKAGVGDAIELKDGENTYLNARLDFYNAILNYNVAVASLEREIGLPLKLKEEKVINITGKDI